MTPNRFDDHPHEGMRRYLFPAAFIGSAVLLYFRHLLLNYPQTFADEYQYKQITLIWHRGEEVSGTAYMAAGLYDLPNALYFAVYSVVHAFGGNFFEVAKAFNVIFYAGGALMVYALARRFASATASSLIALATLWAPTNEYGASFMPENMYFFAAWACIHAYIALVNRGLNRAALAAGVLLGAAYLVKPNALALLVTFNIVVALMAVGSGEGKRNIWTGMRAILALNLAFLAAVFALRILLGGPVKFGFLGGFYGNALSRVFVLEDLAASLGPLVKLTALHFASICLLFAAPILVVASYFARYRGPGREQDVRALLLIAVVGLFVLVIGTTKVTFDYTIVFPEPGVDIGSLHGRYYSTLFPLLLISFAAFHDEVTAHGQAIRKLAVIVAILVAVAVFFLSNHLSDSRTNHGYPDLNWLQWAHPSAVGWYGAAMVGVILYYARSNSPKPLLFAGLYGATLLLAAFMLLRTYLHWEAGYAAISVAGETAARLIHPSERNRGAIIADSKYTAFRFSFSFPGLVRQKIVPSGSTVREEDLAEGVAWVAIAGNVSIALPRQNCVLAGAMKLCRLDGNGPPYVFSNASEWDGQPIKLGFGSGAPAGSLLQGFYDPESWGAWSSDGSPRVLLPKSVSGPVSVTMKLHAYGANVGRDIVVSVGDARAVITPGTNPEEYKLCFDLQESAKEISFSGLDLSPVPGAADSRTMGIGLETLTVQRRRGEVPCIKGKAAWAEETATFRFTSSETESAILKGFHPREQWGTWSRDSAPKVLLPFMISGRVAVAIAGSAFGPNMGRPIAVKIGNTTRDVTFAEGGSTVRFCLHIADPVDEVQFSGLIPSSAIQTGDPRLLGIGLQSMTIERLSANVSCATSSGQSFSGTPAH